MAGLGDAILTARSFIGDEPFAVLLGDDVVINEERPAIKTTYGRIRKKQDAQLLEYKLFLKIKHTDMV